MQWLCSGGEPKMESMEEFLSTDSRAKHISLDTAKGIHERVLEAVTNKMYYHMS